MDRTVTPQRANEMLQKYGDKTYEAMQQAGLAWAFIASRHAIRTKLSGQYLNRRTGKLQRSVEASPEAHVEGKQIAGSFGTNVDYGVAHEQGFHGTVSVRAHERLGHPVRAHERLVNIRARWYLRDSADEQEKNLAVVVDDASDHLLETGNVATAGELSTRVK